MNAHHHAATPTLSVIDPRALAIRGVGYCRHPDSAGIDPRITRQGFDAAGRLVASWDPRLSGTASKANVASIHGLNGHALLTDSVDAGWQLNLLDQSGLPCSFWDARGNQRHLEYDPQQRPVVVKEQAVGEASRVVERLSYGGSDPAFAARNQRGQLIRHDDPASSQIYPEYGMAAAVLREERRFLAGLEMPDWPLEPEARDACLEDQSFISLHTFNPSGELRQQTDAMGNHRTFGYDLAGKSSEAWLQVAGEGKSPKRLVSAIRYNALDQVESETAGNGVVTRAEYAADDGRLLRLQAALGSQNPLQDLNYVYDPVGNIVELQDRSQSATFFNNQRIDPVNRYRYDSLYQLVEAQGWEVSQPSHGPALPALLPTPLDPNQRRNYTQQFAYDRAGNLIIRRHSGAPGFSMFTSARSNRSLAQRDDGSLPGEPKIDSGFDACGNQRELQRGQAMAWDLRNQLSRVTLVMRETEPDDYEGYRYDRPGHRLRKVTVSQASGRTLRTEVRYLPGLEIHRQADGEERHVVSIEAGRNTVRALHWPAGVHDDQLRYSLGDHLGSSTLELDDEAGVLTREHYYPFGGTACWAGKSALVAKYKTLRYSGKERDATGLYYYGYRYYAPWLQRWVSPDPIGDMAGPNHYAMVGNNPVNFVDRFGLAGEQRTAGQIFVMALFFGAMALAGVGATWLTYKSPAAGIALLGAALAYKSWHDSREQRPEAIAARAEAAENRFGEDVRKMAAALAANEGLTEGEAAKFSDFAFDQRNTSDSDGFALRLFHTKTGQIYGYTGPGEAAEKAWRVLSTQKSPVLELNRLGYSTLLVRDTPREQLAKHSTYVAAFGVASPGAVSGLRKTGTSSPSSVSTAPLSTPSTPRKNLEVDKESVEEILSKSSEKLHPNILKTIGMLEEGRKVAAHWHKHADGLFSADLHGALGSRRRGIYRLMFQKISGRKYKAVELRNH